MAHVSTLDMELCKRCMHVHVVCGKCITPLSFLFSGVRCKLSSSHSTDQSGLLSRNAKGTLLCQALKARGT